MNTEKFLQKFLPVFIAGFLINFLLQIIIGFIRWGTLDLYWEGPLIFSISVALLYFIFGDNKNDR